MGKERIGKFKGSLFTEGRFRDSLCKITNSLTSTIRFKVNYTYFLQRAIHASIFFVSNIRIFSWKNLSLSIAKLNKSIHVSSFRHKIWRKIWLCNGTGRIIFLSFHTICMQFFLNTSKSLINIYIFILKALNIVKFINFARKQI